MAVTRVVHAVAGMNYGGYETLIINLYRAIDKQKVQFDFISSFDGVFDKEIVSLGGRIFKIPFITEKGPFAYSKNISKIFSDNKDIKIIHSHMDKFSGMVLRQAKKADIPVRIAHSHSIKNEGGVLFHAVKNYYGGFIEKNATDLFACSKPAAEWLFKQNAQDAVIIKNGIDLNRFKPNDSIKKEMLDSLCLHDSFVVGHVGRFNQPKNHEFLLAVFNEVLKFKSNSKLVLVGDGHKKAAIEQLASKLGIAEKICFLGARNDIEKIMQTFDVFLMPSLYEGVPLTVIEAQSLGIPLVLSDKVSSDSDLTKGVCHLSLETPCFTWAKTVLSITQQPVVECRQNVKDAGYDINKTAQFLTEYYIGRDSFENR